MSIVCGTDFGDSAIRAGEVAAGIAKRLGERLVLVHSLPAPVTTFFLSEPLTVQPALLMTPWRAEVEAKADLLLRGEGNRLAASSGAPVLSRVSLSRPAEALVEVGKEQGARLLVVGSHGRGAVGRALLGSTADRLARVSPWPLLVVRGSSDALVPWSKGEKPLRVLLGVAFEESFGYLADVAELLLAVGPGELHWVHVREDHAIPPAATEGDIVGELSQSITRAAEANGLPAPKARVRILDGKVAPALDDLARREGFDLIVLGTHARKGLERMLLGSTALATLHGASCPVIVAPVV